MAKENLENIMEMGLEELLKLNYTSENIEVVMDRYLVLKEEFDEVDEDDSDAFFEQQRLLYCIKQKIQFAPVDIDDIDKGLIVYFDGFVARVRRNLVSLMIGGFGYEGGLPLSSRYRVELRIDLEEVELQIVDLEDSSLMVHYQDGEFVTLDNTRVFEVLFDFDMAADALQSKVLKDLF